MKFLLPLLLFSLSAFAAEEKMVPTREVAIILSQEGYYPKSISVFEGERVKFYITATVEDPGCMMVEGHKVFLAANKGKISEGEAVFNKAGEFAFYCPSSKNDGKVVVLKKKIKREVASEKKEAVWMPREY